MNDNLLAFGTAATVLAPFAWMIARAWNKIRPLKISEVVWRLTPDIEDNNRLSPHIDWLEQYWREQSQAIGKKWFIRADEGQKSTLVAEGWTSIVDSVLLTRSQANDLLALGRPAEKDDLELLEFFHASQPYPNALVVGHRAATYRLDQTAMQEWAGRPATALQKEGLRYFNLKCPKAISADAAASLLEEQERILYTAGCSSEWNAWTQYAQTWETFQDKSVWDKFDLKKPSVTKLRDALKASMKRATIDWYDPGVIAQQLVDMFPELDARDASWKGADKSSTMNHLMLDK